MESAPQKPPFITRLRSALTGRGRTPSGSPVRDAGSIGMLGHAPEPGPFDSPPPEPIELQGPLPWELQDPKASEPGKPGQHDGGEK